MYLTEPKRDIQVLNEVDVCVLGGSCTGVFAAIRASQMGMKVAIVEKQNCFGGTATAGFVNVWHSLYDTEGKRQIIGGLTQQVLDSLKKVDAVTENPDIPAKAYVLNTEELKIELDRLVLDYSVTPYLHSFFCSAIIKDREVETIIIENKNGRGAIKAKFYIDATGDGDLCRRIGLEHYSCKNVQPPTMCAKIANTQSITTEMAEILLHKHGHEFGLIKDWGWRCNIPNITNVNMHAETHVFGQNCADADMLTYSEIEGRRQVRAVTDIFRKYMPDGKNVALLGLPSALGIRETFHIKSRYALKNEELLNGVRFEDAILNGSYRVDVHHSDCAGITLKYLDGTMTTVRGAGLGDEHGRWRTETTSKSPTFYQLPYRSLIPAGGIRNVLFCGRMLDAEPEAYSALRVMVNTNQMGEAAGMAAALAVNSGCGSCEVDSKVLRAELKREGAIIL